MNPFATFPGIVKLTTDPLGAPVRVALTVIAAGGIVSLLERGDRASGDEKRNGHDPSRGWW